MVKQTASLGLILAASLLMAGSSWDKKDFSQWTEEEALQLLNNSPWAKPATVTKRGKNADEQGYNPVVQSAHPMGQTGLPSYGGNSGGPDPRGGNGGFSPPTGPGAAGQAVTVQWSSALPVRLAQLKASAGSNQPSAMDIENARKDVESYVVTVATLPTPSDKFAVDKRLANAAMLLRKGKAPIRSAKAEVIAAGDKALIMFTFPKSDAIMIEDKEVEFKAFLDAIEVDKKFALKDMQYLGKLEL